MLVPESEWGVRWWGCRITNPAADICVCIDLFDPNLIPSVKISTSRDILTCLYDSVYVVWVSAVCGGLTHYVLTIRAAQWLLFMIRCRVAVAVRRQFRCLCLGYLLVFSYEGFRLLCGYILLVALKGQVVV